LQRFVTRSCTNVGIGRFSAEGDARCSRTPRRPRRILPRYLPAQPESASPREKLIAPGNGGSVKADHLLDRAPARRAERNVVAREHDAVDLRPVIALRLVHRALEGSDLSGVRLPGEHLRILRLLAAEENVHLLLGAVFRSDLPAQLLDLAGVRFECLLVPGGRNRRSRRHEVLPLEVLRVEERRHVRLPRFDTVGGRLVSDVGRVVLVGETREVVAELGDENVR
jgi:hypothetical protein